MEDKTQQMISAAKKLILDISAIKISRTRQTVQLVPQLNVNTGGDTCVMSLGFKIGTDKLYVVKDVYQLLDVIGTNESIEYGKNFIFDDSRHVFPPETGELVNLLIASIRKKPSNVSRQKEFELTGNLMQSVVRELSKVNAEIVVNGRMRPDMQIINDNIPIEFRLSKEDECYKIDFDDCILAEPVTEDCSICIWQGDMYVVSVEQAGCIKAFRKAAGGEDNTSIVFPRETRQKLITHVIPKLRAAGNLEIDALVRRDVIVGELKVKMYIDRTEEGFIKVKADFCYDKSEFNHFAGEKPASAGKVLLRDRRKENAFIRAAADMGFYPENGFLYIFDDIKIYDFMTDGVARLREFGEIYYTDEFNIKVLTPKGGSVGINLSHENLLEFDIGFEGVDEDELASVLASVREKRRFYRLKSGTFVDLHSEGVKGAAWLMDNMDIAPGDIKNAKVQVPTNRAFYLNSIADENITVSRNEYFEKFLEKFGNAEAEDFELPKTVCGTLRPYQVTGFKWLKLLAKYRFGGILADEMGLGKTLQAITLVMSEYEKNPRPTLIVAPTSLLYNWQSEIEKFAPTARSCIVSGTPTDRKAAEKQFDDCHFVITSYGLIRRDIELYLKHNFAFCFIDEAQHIKNPNTINAKVVKKIKAECFFALTGTPLENTLVELWSIFDFIMPGYLYTRHKFRKMYEVPIIKEDNKDKLSSLLRHIKPFILRRLKSQVIAELPEKVENYMVSELEPQQKTYYAAYAAEAKNKISILTQDGGFARNRIEILAIITRLRQICCHPGLFIDGYTGGSGKLEMLKETIESAMQSGHRVLVFSQFTSMLKIISGELEKLGIDYYYLDGGTKSQERLKMVNEFNDGGSDVFLISLKAGGTGLNLTGADMVIHYDPWWNPAVENQATDRAHRIGQTKMVQVLKLVAKGTIEEKICNLQKVKQNMIDSVIETGDSLLSSMTLKEIQELFD